MTKETAHCLKSGEAGIIGGCVCCKRLADMGFVPGNLITMICSGDPCILKMGCSMFGMGQAYQEYIQISYKYSTNLKEISGIRSSKNDSMNQEAAGQAPQYVQSVWLA